MAGLLRTHGRDSSTFDSRPASGTANGTRQLAINVNDLYHRGYYGERDYSTMYLYTTCVPLNEQIDSNIYNCKYNCKNNYLLRTK